MTQEIWTDVDHRMMAKALQLAEHGQFTTPPNPNVGCVIVNTDGDIIGQGWHQQAGGPHAEIHALRQAGAKARGGTAYVTLEPCCHTGKTGPCTQALVAAGITRVVAAMADPNPLVAGNGLQQLTEKGIQTSCGLLAGQAARVNRGFIKRMQDSRPWVTVKLASSLDGKTALLNGKSQWITGAEARRDVQRHRAQSCAILTGSGTLLADDPSMNVRYAELHLSEIAQRVQRQPLRVLLDSNNQLPVSLKTYRLSGSVLLVNRKPCPHTPKHVQQWQAPITAEGKICLSNLLSYLATQHHINSLWVEAGAGLAGALLKNKLVDELIFYQAPKLMGDKARDLVELDELTDMAASPALTYTDIRMLGQDIKITAQPTTTQD